MLFFAAILFFVLLVIIHEFGHYIAAKRNGVEVEEFGIGFPPKIASKTMGKGFWRTEYSLNALPLGGFVRLKGETDSDKRKGSFGAAPLKAKVKIMLAGVGMNLLAAIVIFTFLAAAGMPKLIPNQYLPNTGDKMIVSDEVRVAYVEDESPSKIAGVEVGDTILQFNGVDVTDADQLFDLTESAAGQTVDVILLDEEGNNKSLQATINENNEDTGYFGVGPADLEVSRYTYSAPVIGIATTAQFGYETVKGLTTLVIDLFTADFGNAADSVSGPVGVVLILQSAATFGIIYVLALIGLISLTLAVMNTLPIPALDGGRLAVTLLFRAMKRPLTARTEQLIHGFGFAALMVLILVITYVDIGRFF